MAGQVTKKEVCPYYNVGYCKFANKCMLKHVIEECMDINCSDKKCIKRHRKSCKFGNSCKFNKINICEYKNSDDKIMNVMVQTMNDIVNKLLVQEKEIYYLKQVIED